MERTLAEHIKEKHMKGEKAKEIVLALLQQCKDEGLSVSDVEGVCEMAVSMAQNATLRDGLTL